MKKVDLQAVFENCQPDMEVVLKMFEALIEQELNKTEVLHRGLIQHYRDAMEQDMPQISSDNSVTKHQLKTLTDRYMDIYCHNKAMESKFRGPRMFATHVDEFGPPGGVPDILDFCDVWPCVDDE